MLTTRGLTVSGGAMSGQGERWRTDRQAHAGHHYGAACDFAERVLGDGRTKSCLVIGSPQFEVQMLRRLGWDVTFLDVRSPPWEVEKFIRMDVTELDSLDETFDAISSTCVLTHAGTGRYGDKIVEDGDLVALRKMRDKLNDDAVAVLQIGGLIDGDEMVTVGNNHRLYTLAEARRMMAATGFVIIEEAMWSRSFGWVDSTEGMTLNREGYLCMAVRKC